jgi:DNA-binding PadR family transcriptional regulator
MRHPSTRMAPLSHERLAILLALSSEPMSATEVREQALGDSLGNVVIKYGSLFRLTRELLNSKLINHYGDEAYCPTERGWKLLEQEAARTEFWARTARERLRRQN